MVSRLGSSTSLGTNGSGSKPAILVDARGMRCPWPALRLARAMREADAVTLLADDSAAAREVAALAGEHGWTVEPVAGGFHVRAEDSGNASFTAPG